MSVVDCRLIYKSFTRNGSILTYSSEHPQFPSENIQDDMLVLPWRSRYGTVGGVATGNGLFTITATNKHIDFDDDTLGEKTATLTEGTYNGQTLATEINAQMDTAGGTFAVTYSESTGKFTIDNPSGNFDIYWQSGTNTATSVGTTIGFDVTANDTGAATYTSDTMVIHTSENLDFDLGAAYEYDSVSLLNHNLSATAVVTVYGADDDAFTSNVVSDVLTYNANNIFEFIAAARTKSYVRLHIIDKDNVAGYVQVGAFVVGKYLAPNRVFGPYSEGEVDSTQLEYSPSNNAFTVQERPALINRDYSFSGLDATAIAGVRLLLAECGIRKAFWVCTDSTAANANSYWVRLRETSMPHCEQFGYWNWDMPVEQVL